MDNTRLQNPNLKILMSAVDQLDDLADEMVFLGGCATGLLITDLAAPPIRVTQDVDAVIQAVSRVEYYQFSEKLRSQGFSEDSRKGAPLCRWVGETVTLDVMPMNPEILGFGNKWYAPAITHAKEIVLPSGKIIQMVSAPYFLITKLEAFDGRGRGDYLLSHDMEDIIAVLDGRPEILDEVKHADKALKKELSLRFHGLLADNRFIESISGHLPTDEISQARSKLITEKIKNMLAC